MRTLIAAAVLLALGFASCKKQEVIVNSPKDKPPYRVSGISDVTIERNPFSSLQPVLPYLFLSVLYERGDSKRITLNMENMPTGLKDSFSLKSGYPEFYTSVRFYDKGAQEGNYTANLVAKADGDSVSTSYPFSIIIKGSNSCAKYFAGKSYSALNSCSATSPNPLVPYNAGAFQLNGTDTLVISNFKNDGSNLKVFINCPDSKVTVPTQIIGGKSIVGYGELVDFRAGIPNIISVNLTEVDAQGNVALCNYSFEVK